MPPASQPANFNLQEFTDVGQLLVGGKLYTYAYGTTAQKTAFTDPEGTVPHTYTLDGAGGQYIALNARGELPAPLYLGDGSYDISLKRADGSTVWTRKADGVEASIRSSNGTSIVNGQWFGGVAAAVSALATAVGAALIGWANAGTAISVEQALNILYEGSSHVSNPRFAGGAKGDGVRDDTAAIQAAINSGGRVHFNSGATYKVTTPLVQDISKSALYGCGTVIKTTSANGALQVYSSASYGAERLDRNWTHWNEGIALEGDKITGNVLVTVGHAAYLNNSEITFRNCSFRNAGTLVKFIDNAWRANFDHCGFESAEDYYLHFNTPANAGEMMRYSHCWFVDGPAFIYLKEGQHIFDTCSFPGGGIGGIQCVGAPHVIIRNCNLETQPAAANQYLVEGYGSSFILIDGCIISTNGGQANQALLAASDACGMRIVNCTLPLFGGDLRSEANSGIRQIVTGNSQYVSAANNYVKGTGANDRTQWAVLGKQLNKLLNGDAELGTTAGWTVSTYGAVLTGTFTNVGTTQKTGTRCFMLDCPANGGVEASQTIGGASAYIGRTVVFGMWEKTAGGTGNVDFPMVRFLDDTGVPIGNTAIGTSSADGSWTWIGGYGVVPVGTDRIQLAIGGQEQSAAHQIYYDDIVLNVI
jgi:hypothetical protein